VVEASCKQWWRAESHTWRDDSKGSAGELAALQHAESQEEGTG
jgi:hypothetical protein